jgi:hypothetical protein
MEFWNVGTTTKDTSTPLGRGAVNLNMTAEYRRFRIDVAHLRDKQKMRTDRTSAPVEKRMGGKLTA